MRIVSGTFSGRRLRVPEGRETRPTSDRVREALFSVLESWDVMVGARVLDLFAGSGALGLEAMSRGAIDCVLVDSSRPAAMAISANIAALELSGVRLVNHTASRFLAGARVGPGFDLVFLDPPYGFADEDLATLLAALDAWAAPDPVIVVERSSRDAEPVWAPGFERTFGRKYGETFIWMAERVRDDAAESAP